MTDADATVSGDVDATGSHDPQAGEAPIDDLVVSAHSTTPDRTVLTEHDNADGWIASSLTLDLRR